MQYILDEDEVKCLLLCRKYIEELCNNMIKSINANPKLKNNKESNCCFIIIQNTYITVNENIILANLPPTKFSQPLNIFSVFLNNIVGIKIGPKNKANTACINITIYGKTAFMS